MRSRETGKDGPIISDVMAPNNQKKANTPRPGQARTPGGGDAKTENGPGSVNQGYIEMCLPYLTALALRMKMRQKNSQFPLPCAPGSLTKTL